MKRAFSLIGNTFDQILSDKLPKWFKAFNFVLILPCFLSPFVFFFSIFIFDNPSNLLYAYGLFFLINAYPIYLFIIASWNTKLFLYSKILGVILPIITLLSIIYCINYFVESFDESNKKNNKRHLKEKRKVISGVVIHTKL